MLCSGWSRDKLVEHYFAITTFFMTLLVYREAYNRIEREKEQLRDRVDALEEEKRERERGGTSS